MCFGGGKNVDDISWPKDAMDVVNLQRDPDGERYGRIYGFSYLKYHFTKKQLGHYDFREYCLMFCPRRTGGESMTTGDGFSFFFRTEKEASRWLLRIEIALIKLGYTMNDHTNYDPRRGKYRTWGNAPFCWRYMKL